MTADLTPYVPRLVLEWANETPETAYRAIDGTLVFCDVSGFTALSERLARLGKLGAEELNVTLNVVFSELLDRAAEHGGSMLKYGGDAILVFFWGDDHARRGAAAAAAMRTALRRVGNIRTAGGRVRLRMSVGVHTGSFDFFLVGDSHRELIVTGPSTTMTCALETTAEAGEILISPVTAAALAKSTLGARKGDGVLLARAPVAPREAASAVAAGDTDAAAYVPAVLRDHLGAGGHEPEHRLVTAAFVAFSGLDAALAARGGDAVASDLHDLIESCQRHFDHFGIAFLTTDIYGDGGKVFAATGAPRMWPNNEERMLRALREILDEDHAFHLHAGVQRGYAFAGDVGPPFRRTYTLLGDVINTAARVMASASHGQLRVMPEVVERSTTLFATEQQPPFAAKGKKEPLVTYAVDEVVGARTSQAEDLPYIGRVDQLDDLVTLARGALAGTGGAIELVGPSGVGKTRLVTEVLARLPEADVLTAAGAEYEQTTAYAAVLPMIAAAAGVPVNTSEATLRRRVRKIAPELEAWLPLIGMVFGIETAPTPEVKLLADANVADRMRAIVIDLLGAGRPSPTVFRLEDVQWADEPSRLLLAAIATSGHPWLLLTTAHERDVEIVASPLARVDLAGLDAVESLALLRSAAPGRFLPDEAARLVDQAGGNALFLRELAVGGSKEVLPDSIEAAVASRIDSLDPTDRAHLRAAAVLGLSPDSNTLRELTGGDVQLTGGLEEFLVETDEGFRFRQTIFRRAAYLGLSFRRRRALHGAAGRAMEAASSDPKNEAAVLHRHFHEAQDYAKSWHYGRIAAQAAASAFASAESAVLYRRALNAARSLEIPTGELADAWQALALQLEKAGHVAEVPDALRRARNLVSDPARCAELCMKEGQIRQHLGNPVAARRWYRRGIAFAAAGSDREARRFEARLHSALGETYIRQGRLKQAMAEAAAGLEIATAIKDKPGAAHNHILLGVALVIGGDAHPDQHFRDAIPLYETVPDYTGVGQAYGNLGNVAQRRGEWGVAAEHFEKSLETLYQAGEVVAAAATEQNLAEILLDQGRTAEARTHFESALDVFRAAGSWYAAYVERNLALVEASDGRIVHAHQLLGDARATFAEVGAVDEVVAVEIAVATVLIAEGRAAEAIEHLAAIDIGARPVAAGRVEVLRAVLGVADPVDARATATEVGDPVSILYARVLLGESIDADRQLLGIEALPVWLTRSDA